MATRCGRNRSAGASEPPAGPGKATREEGRMKGLIAAAGLSTRLQDLSQRRNKVLLDLGGDSVLGTILNHFELVSVAETFVMVGHDALNVRLACGTRARCVLNPFYEHAGILGSIWLARPFLDGVPFVFTTGDH